MKFMMKENNYDDDDTLSIKTSSSASSLHSMSIECTANMEEENDNDLGKEIEFKCNEISNVEELEKENDNDLGIKLEFKCNEISNVEDLEKSLLSLLTETTTTLSYKNKCIESILLNTNLSTNELNRFLFWSNEKPYTRNCIINNDKFTAMILCWNPNSGSSIHDHPCDACFIKGKALYHFNLFFHYCMLFYYNLIRSFEGLY